MSYVAVGGLSIIFGDASSYVVLAGNILYGGLQNFYDIQRTYGYPFMLAVVEILEKFLGISALSSVIFVQYGMLVLTAWFSTRLLIRLLRHECPRWLKWLTFLLILWNPLLLGSIWDLLPDLPGMFLVMLGIMALLSRSQWRFFWVSAVCAALIVTKPLYYYWIIAAGILLVVYYILFHRPSGEATVSRLDDLREAVQKIRLRTALFVMGQIALPLILILGMQFYHVWKNEQIISLYSRVLNKEFIETQLELSVAWYKRETYQLADDGVIGYIDLKREEDFRRFMESFSENRVEGVVQYLLSDIPSTMHSMLVRLVGIFQSYEWSTYRQATFVAPTYPFWWGLFLFTLFIYTLFYWCRHRFGLSVHVGFVGLNRSIWMMFFILIYSFIPIYVITNAEPRYLFPVLPLLTLLGIAAIYQERPKWALAGVAVLCTVIYFYVLQVLVASQV